MWHTGSYEHKQTQAYIASYESSTMKCDSGADYVWGTGCVWQNCFSPRLLQGWSQVEQAGRLQLPSSVNRGEPRQSDLDWEQEWSVWYNLIVKGLVNRTREINCFHSALLQNLSGMLWLNRPVEAQWLIGCVWSSASQRQMAVPAGQDGARRLRNGMMPQRPD